MYFLAINIVPSTPWDLFVSPDRVNSGGILNIPGKERVKDFWFLHVLYSTFFSIVDLFTDRSFRRANWPQQLIWSVRASVTPVCFSKKVCEYGIRGGDGGRSGDRRDKWGVGEDTGGQGRRGCTPPPAFHTLTMDMSLNRGVTHFTLGLRSCIISSFLL